MQQLITLAATGSTGNNTHAAVKVGGHETMAFLFIVEAVGSTPTVTYKYQGSIDGSAWHDVALVPSNSDTLTTAPSAVTTTGTTPHFLANPVARRYQYYRCVTSANTNVTYRAEAYKIKSDD